VRPYQWLVGKDTMQYITQCPHYSRLITRRFRKDNYLLFQIVKEPGEWMVGLDGFEPSTPALSRRCSNQLSYRPAWVALLLLPFRRTADRWWALDEALDLERR
jgi:hypothetical protein